MDILISRSSSKEVDVVGSEGLWLSPWDLRRNIDVDYKFQLASGDVLLLFTDGITECRNEEREMFSEEKLIGILKQYGSGSTEAIKDRIFEDLSKYDKNDDLTLIVIKKI